MPDYQVTVRRKSPNDPGYDRMLDMLEANHEMAPINPGDEDRVYIVTAASSTDAGTVIGRLLDAVGYGDWPEHIAEFKTAGL